MTEGETPDDPTVRRAAASARARWPEIALDDEDFARHLQGAGIPALVPGERAEAYTGLRRSDFTDNALNLCVGLASQVSRVERIGANEELIEHYAE